MNRRSPVRSVLAERRLFSNGGMLPISTPFQNTPSGILASSPPLIEAVSQEIVAPFTGGAMPMAQGGVAKFQEGGFAAGTLGSQYGFDFNPQGIEIEMVPSITPTRTYTHDKKLWPPGIQSVSPGAHHPRRTGVVATFDPDNPTPMSYGDILSETASEKVLRLFPEWSRTTQTLTVGEEVAPEREKRLEEEGRPFSRAYDAFLHGVTATKQFIAGNVEELSQDAEAFFRTIFGGETRGDIPTENLLAAMSQTRAVMEMIQRAPPEFEDDIKLFAREAVLKNPALTQDGLAEAVAMRLSDKHEGDPNIGIGTAEQERAELLREHRAPEPVSPDMPPFISRMPTESGVTPAELLEDPTRDLATQELLEDRAVFTEAARMQEAMRENKGKIPDDYWERHSKNPDHSDEFKQAVRDIVNSQPLTPKVPTAAAVTPDDAPAVTPDAVPAAAVRAAAVPAAADLPRGEDEDWYRQNMYDPAAVAETFDKPDMTPEQAEKDVKFYVDEFKKSMPDYEGASREEQGWAIFEAGMRIMAGQSPHAMTNISAGLKGLGTEFAKDAKEKRAWDRQVDLSAAKYALASVKSDKIQAEALAKENRKLYEKMLVVRKGVEPFYYKGKLLGPGSRVVVPVGEIRDGSFPLDKVQSETSLVDEIKSANATTRSYLSLAEKQIVTPRNVPVKRYIADSMRLRTNIATRSLLSRALVELQKPGGEGPLGVKATAKRALLILANALNKKQLAESYFGSLTSQNDFDDFTKRAVTTQIEGLINEGGKITDQERELALDIGGALSKGAWSGAFADRDKLERQIVEFSQALDRDSESRIRSMSLDEKTWDRHYRNLEDAEKGYSYGAILREAMPKLHDPAAPRAARVIPDSINWKDIIIVGEDGEITGFKWDLAQ